MSGQDTRAIWLHVHLSQVLKRLEWFLQVTTKEVKHLFDIYVFFQITFPLISKLIYAPFPDFAVYVLVSILLLYLNLIISLVTVLVPPKLYFHKQPHLGCLLAIFPNLMQNPPVLNLSPPLESSLYGHWMLLGLPEHS